MNVSCPKYSIGLFLLMVASVATVFPQDATFEASVDRNPVGLGDQFTFSLVLKNAGAGGGKNLQLPDLSKFHIMSGPNQSTSMQFINGVVSSSVTYSYVLQPRETGKFTINAASIEAGGHQYRTNPITLEVTRTSSKPKAQAGTPPDISSQLEENLFLRASVDKNRVIQGEQINLEFKLYMRVSVTNYSITKSPAMIGFWGEDVETPKNIALGNEVLNGKQYRVGIIKKMALFPTQSGTLEISPMEVQTTVQIQDTRMIDPFDAFFRDPFGRTVNYEMKSEPVKIKVDPLPQGAPPSFKGAVGRFTMNSTTDTKQTKTNEPISLKITLSGTGNIKLLESPQVELPVDFEQYTPKVSDNINRQEQRISGSKTFEYLLIPRYPGEKVIKPVEFSFFDLSKREYVTLRTPQIVLTVEQGIASSAPAFTGAARADLKMLSQDIRFIKVVHGGLSKKGDRFYKHPLFFLLVALPLIGFGAVLIYGRQQQIALADTVQYRNSRALKVAKRGLKRAGQLLGKKGASSKAERAGNGLEFYAEVSRAVHKYLGDKLNISTAEISIDGVLANLEKRKINGEISAAIKTLLESCEMARFAPGSLDAAAMKRTYDDAEKLIVNLERVLKR